jgi:RNA polymerase sigma factor (sigma-70 family)
MKTNRLASFVRRVSQAARTGLSDSELLDALSRQRDPAAFEVLLERHGPMVLAVCRRVLGSEVDAEDAFQTTFLILIRKAAAIRRPEAIASWLYGVAYITARKVRTLNWARRTVALAADLPARANSSAEQIALDEEIHALPQRYRIPLVLCELQGRPRREVAKALNIPEGTLSSRLATARKMLAKRMRRHGWTLSALPAGETLSRSLVTTTLNTGTANLAGRAIAEVASPSVTHLVGGVNRAMLLSKVKMIPVALVLLGAISAGADRVARVTVPTATAIAADELRPPGTTADAADQAPPRARDTLLQAAASVAAAEAELQRAQAKLAAARARLELERRQQREAIAKNALHRPIDRAALSEGTQRLMSRFKYHVPVEAGRSQSKDGGRIEILDVWGTQPEIKVGGCYLVHGKYSMPNRDRGTLYFHLSATDERFAYAYDNDLQCASAHKGEGEFTLMHIMVGPGQFHLHLIGENFDQPSSSTTVADLYFGTGDNVWREK